MTELSKIMTLLNENNTINNDTLLSSDYDEELFDQNYKCLIKKDADIIIPKYLVLHLNNDGTLHLINEIKEKINFSSLTCSLNNTNIYNISLKLLLDLSLPRIINNKLYILLPPYLLSSSLFNCINNTSNQLILTLVRRGELMNIITRCSIILNKQNISKITYNDIFNSSNNKNKMIDSHYQKTHIIQQVRSLFIYPNSKSEIFTNNLQTRGIVKGIFIYADIYQLIELKLFLDYQVYLHYDYQCINGYCKRINSNLIYLPVSNGCDYTSIENNSYSNAINLNNVVSTTISLRFHVPQKQVILHVLIKNEIIELENKSILENYYDIDPLVITNML